MTGTGEQMIAAAIDAAEWVAEAPRRLDGEKPRLLVDDSNPDRTVAALRDILASAGELYDRGVPVRLAFDQTQGGVVAQVLGPDLLVMKAHEVCRPYAWKKRDGVLAEVDVRLPRVFAATYLEWRGEWRLPPLNGIACAPVLQDDGTIESGRGYDRGSGLWRETVPDLSMLVPKRPDRRQAEAALRTIRETFRTFCFADAITVAGSLDVPVVDIEQPPGKDESAFLVVLLTAVCRPSLHLSPGVLLRAAAMSGAGAGKGLLARCISMIAFGREPHAVTGGSNAEELEKRIAAELIEGSPVLFLDNLNNVAFRSDLLASAITERPARVRVLGKSQMVPLNASALIVLTGNGLSVSEDLARRFIAVDFDPGTEDPEARAFATDIRAEVQRRRPELLAALLTIWRWGRQSKEIVHGRTLGSFETWCRWVRDPLLSLGCRDPADRIAEAKERDTRRQFISELFGIWWARHADQPVTASRLHDDVKQVADPHGRSRQYLAGQLDKLASTRAAGFMLTRQPSPSKWGAATYALRPTREPENHRDHRDHRDHRGEGQRVPGDVPGSPAVSAAHEQYGGGTQGGSGPSTLPMPPMVPMLSGAPAWQTPSVVEMPWSADDWGAFNERAAILEFDAGLPRGEAEAKALVSCLAGPGQSPSNSGASEQQK